MSAHVSAVPVYGRRLLPALIDERAQTRHERPYASIPVSNDLADGFRDISYTVFASAINRCSAWLLQAKGRSTSFETLAYIGPQDLRYQILCIAAVKVGYVTFLPSPRNIPGLENLLQPTPHVEELPFTGSFEERRRQPFLILHTSGSTGIPKIIIIRHGFLSPIDGFSAFERGTEIAQKTGNRRIFSPLPFLMSGINGSLCYPLWIDTTVVLPPPAPLTASLMNSILIHGRVDYAMLLPSLIVDMAKEPEHLRTIGNLKGIAYGGGPLPPPVGEKISALTTLCSLYGSTEMNFLPLLPTTMDKED